ncbi:MAG: alpha/beta fold hydrolase [Actinomycetota bacterium]|nr:alpha/beta hydrolase [Actinomycetota bacterium]
MAKSSRRSKAIWFGAAAASLAAGVIAERAYVKRDRSRPDPDAGEPFGTLRGEIITNVLSSDGTKLHVEEWGSGPTIVLAHGFSLALDLWHYQIADLGRDYRVVAFDQRGHARSGRPPTGDWSLEALAHDLDAVVRAAGPEPVAIVGHSMGGMQVLQYCRQFPEAIGSRVSALALVDTTAADVMGGMVPGVGRYVQATVQGFEEAAVRALAVNTHRIDRIRGRVGNVAYLATRFMGFGIDPSPSKVAFVEKLLAETPSDVVVALLPTMSGMDVSDVLDSIDVPTLVAVGSHDRLTPAGAARRLAEAIKDAELYVIEGAGHSAVLERPHEFNAALRRFLVQRAGWK